MLLKELVNLNHKLIYKIMVRNVLLAALISTFALFGALGSKDTKTTLVCLAVAFAAWALCVWRVSILNRRRNERNQAERLFSDHMRKNARSMHRF